jgi:DNA-directed RNA polymerase subunit beta
VLSAEGQEIEFRDSDDAFRAAEELGIDLSRPERYGDEFSLGAGS